MKENSLTILYICHFISHSFFQFPGMYLVDICLFWVGVFWLLGKKKKTHHCSIDLEWCMRQIRSVWDVATDHLDTTLNTYERRGILDWEGVHGECVL